MRPGKRERQAIALERQRKLDASRRAALVPDDGIRMHNACNLLVSRANANAPFARPMSNFDGTVRVARKTFSRWGTK